MCEQLKKPTPVAQKGAKLPEKSERERKIEMTERKLKTAIAMCEEALNQLRELKAA